MFAKNNNSVKFGDDRELATFPTLPNLVSVENDATLAKSATAVGYAHKRKIEQMTRCARIMGVAVKQLVEVISLQLEKLQDAADKCKSLTKATEAQIHFFTRWTKNMDSVSPICCTDHTRWVAPCWRRLQPPLIQTPALLSSVARSLKAPFY